MSKTSKHHAEIVWDGDRHDLRAHTIRLVAKTLAGSSISVRGDGSR
jgi:hypothetical protein